MQFHANYLTVSEAGEYFDVSLHTRNPALPAADPFELDCPYLIVQSQFENWDGGLSYVESHDPDFCGHFRLRLLEFSPTRLAFKLRRPRNNLIDASFQLSEQQFKDAQRIVNIIFRLVGMYDDPPHNLGK